MHQELHKARLVMQPVSTPSTPRRRSRERRVSEGADQIGGGGRFFRGAPPTKSVFLFDQKGVSSKKTPIWQAPEWWVSFWICLKWLVSFWNPVKLVDILLVSLFPGQPTKSETDLLLTMEADDRRVWENNSFPLPPTEWYLGAGRAHSLITHSPKADLQTFWFPFACGSHFGPFRPFARVVSVSFRPSGPFVSWSQKVIACCGPRSWAPEIHVLTARRLSSPEIAADIRLLTS